MTAPNAPEQVDLREEVAKAIGQVLETDNDIYWASEYGRPTPQASLNALADAAVALIVERCAEVCEEQGREFLSPQYATPQPVGSIRERFACDVSAAAIRALAPQPGDPK